MKLVIGQISQPTSAIDILLSGAYALLNEQVQQFGNGIVRAPIGEVFVYKAGAQGLFLRVWGLQQSNPLTWIILRNAVDLLKECMFDLERFATASFEIYDGTSPKAYGEGTISFNPTEVSNPHAIDWTLAGTSIRAQIVPSSISLSRSQLENLFSGAFESLTSHIIDLTINSQPITDNSNFWSYSTGPGELGLSISSVNSDDPITWLSLKQGVEAIQNWMSSQNHWSFASALIFDDNNEVGMAAILMGEPARERRRRAL